MVEVNHCIHKVYLAKGDSVDLYIDATLPQQHIEAVRFLYRLYTKKKPGAILNDPSGYGKRVQTVIYINAMRQRLDRPVLILCKEGNEHTWLHRFHTWTGLGSETSIELMNPPVLKSFVTINPMTNINTFTRREWSIVVIDDSTVTRDLLRATLHTNFKIWITNVDMKKNLQTFSLIHKWLYPKDKFNVEDFEIVTRKPSTVHMKSIVLDAFMEDIVLRRKGDSLPLGRRDDSVRNTVTRKNKDATGKKIKRSKRESDPKSTLDQNIVPTIDKDLLNNFEASRQHDITTSNDNIDAKKRKLSDSLNINSDEMTINMHSEENNVNTQESFSLLNDEISSQEIRMRYDSGSDVDAKTIHDIDRIDSQEEKNGDPHLDASDKADSRQDENKQESDKVSNAKDDEENSKTGSTDLFMTNEITINCDKNSSVTKNIVESEDLFTNTQNDEGNETCKINDRTNEDCETNDKGTRNGNGVVNSNKSESELGVIIENKTEISDVGMRMKQLEELTMKKFKGSLLDSIF